MNQITPIFKREFFGYFRSPVAYVFLIVFLIASVGFAFFLGRFFDSGVASLEGFFTFLPWLFLFLIPAAGMRLWSEEKRAGTWELLFTLPLSTVDAVVGKFLAAWAFISLAIVLTFPMWITVSYLGDPDHGVIVTSYIGTILMAGSYLGICSLTSALTKNQVISFVISVIVCLVLVLLGWSVFSGLLNSFLPVGFADVLSNFSFTSHFEGLQRGVIALKDVLFFVSLMIGTLWLNVIVLER